MNGIDVRIETELQEDSIDVDEKQATIVVTVAVGLTDDPGGEVEFTDVQLFLDVVNLPETVRILGDLQEGTLLVFDLDVDAINYGEPVRVPVTVMTGEFTGAGSSADPGDYIVDAWVRARYAVVVGAETSRTPFAITVED